MVVTPVLNWTLCEVRIALYDTCVVWNSKRSLPSIAAVVWKKRACIRMPINVHVHFAQCI